MIIATCALLVAVTAFYIFAIPLRVASGPEKTRLIYLGERKEVIYENLRDLNFEYKAGKLSEADYQSLQASLEDEAARVLGEMARIEAATSPAASVKGKIV